jgi:hypothetical protein
MLVLPPVALASQTYTDSASGYEVYATSTEGTFIGTTSGVLPGSWGATIDHTPLSPNAEITGGSFYLSTAIGGYPVVVTGRFSGGTVTRTNPGATGCVNQYYSVDANLSNVGIGLSGSGTGSFVGTLTHHRTSIYGYCVTYSATITGQLSLTF